jgi:hypothetical protein
MTTEEFIEDAIDRGRRNGLSSLNARQRTVFMIAEADAYSAMEGVDSFIDRIETGDYVGASEAFNAVGAVEIARCLRQIEDSLPIRDEDLLNHTNHLITEHIGFTYEAIKRYVEEG